MKNIKNRKGFTLIELLVVIAIIAVLAVVVILTLNPAELLRQARDSNRISDFGTLKSAISLFLADVATTSANALGTYGTLYANGNGQTLAAAYVGASAGAYGYAGASATSVNSAGSSSRGISGAGTGWLPVKFDSISSGSPIGNE